MKHKSKIYSDPTTKSTMKLLNQGDKLNVSNIDQCCRDTAPEQVSMKYT